MNSLIKKTTLGQFFTKKNFWLKPHIVDFIKSVNADIAFDPFAGSGDLLNVATEIGIKNIKGFDIDKDLKWEINDSLVSIPTVSDSIIITNPPYLTNYSAKRKGVIEQVQKYFDSCKYDDLYQLAIEKCLSNDFGVMIIPETFINSTFPKNRLVSITIIEDEIFNDTENPVCVICFDNKEKKYDQIKVYKNDRFLGTLQNFEKMRKFPGKHIHIRFNSLNGQIALRAVDTTDPKKPISFMRPDQIDYDMSKIKVSSRLITLIELNVHNDLIDKIIDFCNLALNEFRVRTHDVLLSPFKGNKKNGERRRRLDYLTARALLEEAYEEVHASPKLF